MIAGERVWPRCFACSQPVDIARSFFEGFCWLLDQQNRDGTWGRTWEEKAIYTPHAVQLFVQAGFRRDYPRLQAAISWLKNSLSHSNQPLWYGRIPALVSAGEIKWLRDNGDIDTYLNDLDKNKIPDFFWYVLPVMISLKRIGQDAPYADVARRLQKYERAFSKDYITVMHKPNHTGLAMIYLHTVDPEKYQDRIQRMLNWIIVTHHSEDTGVIHWDNSIGITAYVLIDLAELGVLYESKIAQLVQASLGLFKPLPEGNMPPDRFATTYETSIHEKSLYTTLLALRAMATVLGRDNCVMRSAAAIGIERYVDRKWKVNLGRFVRRHRRALIIGAIASTTFFAITGLLFLLDVRSLVLNVSIAIFGAV